MFSRNALRRFRKSESGVTAIEFAIVAPILMLLSCGVFEVSLLMASLVSLEGGLKEASRYGITGQTPNIGTREQQIKAILADHTLKMIDLTSATIDIKTFSSFSTAQDGEPYGDTNGNGQYDLGEPYSDLDCNNKWNGPGELASDSAGQPGQVVQYTVNFDWKVITPLISTVWGKSSFPMSASIIVKNEPNLYSDYCAASNKT